MDFVIECQEEYNNTCKPIDRHFPITEDVDCCREMEKEIEKNLFEPEKIDRIVSTYDVFPTQTHKKWRKLIDLLKLYCTGTL